MVELPRVGDVWRYPFLWSREAASGETEGRKPRPVALILVTRTAAGETEVLMAPITTQPPTADAFALEVPDIEKRRAGLDPHLRLWVVTEEVNADLPGRSFYFEPDGRIGAFSLPFTKAVQTRMIEALRGRRLIRVNRR